MQEACAFYGKNGTAMIADHPVHRLVISYTKNCTARKTYAKPMQEVPFISE